MHIAHIQKIMQHLHQSQKIMNPILQMDLCLTSNENQRVATVTPPNATLQWNKALLRKF